jgi:hypothetical protein
MWTILALLAPLFRPVLLDDPPSPTDSTLGAKPPQGAIVLYEGGALKGWTAKDGTTAAGWTASPTHFTVKPGAGDIRTEKTFGDQTLHIEFNCPLMPEAKGQARGNSGVYLAGVYEVQVLDSYGLQPSKNDCGAIYNQVAPKVNACKPPLQWQTYDITFRKARLQDGEVVEKARVTVVQNGIPIIEDAEIDPTPGGVSMEAGQDGPLLLQDHGNEVEFRNIWVLPSR